MEEPIQQTADKHPTGVPNHQNLNVCYLNVGQLGLNQSRAPAARPPTIPLLPPRQVPLARYQVLRQQVVTTISTKKFAVPIPNQGSFPNTNPGLVYEAHQKVKETTQIFQSSRGLTSSRGFSTPGAHQIVPSRRIMIDQQKKTGARRRVHRRYPCLECGEMFITELCYAEHMASHHQANNNVRLMMIRKASGCFNKRTHVAQSKSSGQSLIKITGKEDP